LSLNKTLPVVGFSRVPRIWRSVVFPAPLLPTTETISPSLMDMSIPFRIFISFILL